MATLSNTESWIDFWQGLKFWPRFAMRQHIACFHNSWMRFCEHMKIFFRWRVSDPLFSEIYAILCYMTSILITFCLTDLKELTVTIAPSGSTYRPSSEKPFVTMVSIWYALELIPGLRTNFLWTSKFEILGLWSIQFSRYTIPSYVLPSLEWKMLYKLLINSLKCMKIFSLHRFSEGISACERLCDSWQVFLRRGLKSDLPFHSIGLPSPWEYYSI